MGTGTVSWGQEVLERWGTLHRVWPKGWGSGVLGWGSMLPAWGGWPCTPLTCLPQHTAPYPYPPSYLGGTPALIMVSPLPCSQPLLRFQFACDTAIPGGRCRCHSVTLAHSGRWELAVQEGPICGGFRANPSLLSGLPSHPSPRPILQDALHPWHSQDQSGNSHLFFPGHLSLPLPAAPGFPLPPAYSWCRPLSLSRSLTAGNCPLSSSVNTSSRPISPSASLCVKSLKELASRSF